MEPEKQIDGDLSGDKTETTTPEPVDIDAGLREAIKAGVDEAGGKKAEPDDTGEAEPAPAPVDKSAPAATAKAALDAPPEDKGRKSDPVDDPIPDDVKGRTRERMEALIARVKETRGEVEQISKDRNDLVGMVTETKATPEQFNATLDYLRAVNSGDPKQIEKAIETVQRELEALSQMIGKPVPGIDTLAKHADLRAAVDAGNISDAHARELAAMRDQRAFATRRQEVAHTQEQQGAQQAQAMEEGKQALNELEKQLRVDPDYGRKKAILVPALQDAMAQVHPSQWSALFRQAYERLKLSPLAVAPEGAASSSRPQPLRARQPAGGVAKQPGSILEAMREGLAQVRK